jgi:hypothetical protein
MLSSFSNSHSSLPQAHQHPSRSPGVARAGPVRNSSSCAGKEVGGKRGGGISWQFLRTCDALLLTRPCHLRGCLMVGGAVFARSRNCRTSETCICSLSFIVGDAASDRCCKSGRRHAKSSHVFWQSWKGPFFNQRYGCWQPSRISSYAPIDCLGCCL